MQEVITYLIIAVSVGLTLYWMGKSVVQKKQNTGCTTGGCSSCSFNGGCSSGQTFTPRS